MACLKDVLSQLPNGLNSSLGDRGKFLSGGQQQRVAIARALYQDPKIIIFDEATSSQDIKNEELIRKSIENIKGNITIISISHKFYTIKNCDHIFLINNGKIEAQGNYSKLLKESQLFRELEGSIKNQK
jgi:ATP-binding cassette subfamily C protein